MSDSSVLLRATELSKWFGATHALRRASLDIRAGEVHALAGANGSGKSTLVKILAGAYQADGGQIEHKDGLVIATVHQDLALFGDATVRENICGALPKRLLSTTRELNVVAQMFDNLGVSISQDAKVNELPVDHQAFVAVARALTRTAGAPGAVLIVDEVTSVLRGDAALRFADVLRRLRDQGVGIVLVSHDLDEVLGLADWITVLADGAVRAVQKADGMHRRQLIELITGVQVGVVDVVDCDRAEGAAPLLSVTGLSGSLLHDFDIDVRPSEVVGLIGLPGSGYDETPYLIAGVGADRRGGEVRLGGCPIRNPRAFAANGGRLIPADRGRTGLISSGSVLENYMLGHQGGVARWGLRSSRRERGLTELALSRYNIKCAGASAGITSLSGGNQQKLIMARCLEVEPKLLVVHEPTQGVDVRARADLLRQMHLAVSDRSLGVLYVCGDLNEVWDNAHRVVVVRHGRKVGDARVSSTSRDDIHDLLY